MTSPDAASKPSGTPRRLGAFALALSSTLALFASVTTAYAQEVEVYTMGPGADVFSRFGHAALCVRDASAPGGRCFNYGTTDFSTPGPLTWNVLRGRAVFWVSESPLDAMLAWYVAEDRTIWRQRVRLSPDAFTALQHRLRDDLRPDARSYIYHHFRDNCTTRIRDHLDAVTLGALRGSIDLPFGISWRAMLRAGFQDAPSLLVASTLLLGRPLDAIPSRWEAMFLPAVLRTELGLRLHANPEVLYQRRAKTPRAHPSADSVVFILLATLLALIALFALAHRPQRFSLVRASQTFAGILTGTLGLAVWVLASVSTLSELHDNDLRPVLLPTDLALGALGGRTLAHYARARVAMAVTASCLHALGATPQPLYGPALVVVAAMLPWTLWPRRSPALPRVANRQPSVR